MNGIVSMDKNGIVLHWRTNPRTGVIHATRDGKVAACRSSIAIPQTEIWPASIASDQPVCQRCNRLSHIIAIPEGCRIRCSETSTVIVTFMPTGEEPLTFVREIEWTDEGTPRLFNAPGSRLLS